MKKLNSKAFGAVEVILMVVILALIGGVGYYIYDQNKEDNTYNNDTATTQSTTQEKAKTEATPQTPAPTTKTYKGLTGITFEYPTDWKVISSGAELGSEDSLVIQTSDFVEGSQNRPSEAKSGAKIIYTAQESPESVAGRTVDEANYTASIKIMRGDMEHQFRIDTSSKAAFQDALKVLDQMAASFK